MIRIPRQAVYLALAVCLLLLVDYLNRDNTTIKDVTPVPAPTKRTYAIKLRVSGNARYASVLYTNPGIFYKMSAFGVDAPWEEILTGTTFNFGDEFGITVYRGDDSGELGCEIYLDGKLIQRYVVPQSYKESDGRPVRGSATCVAKLGSP